VDVLLSGLGTGLRDPQVLARTHTDPEGRFQLTIPAEEEARRFAVAVWAYVPKRSIVGRSMPLKAGANPAEAKLDLKLGAPARAGFQVTGPDGKPVAMAKVTPKHVHVADGMPPTSSFPLPEEIAKALAATTGAEGTAEIEGLRADDMEWVVVEANGLGRQDMGFRKVLTALSRSA
jgi:hypothetical protein